MKRALASLLAALATLAPATAAEELSLEQLLERYRAEQERLFTTLRVEVERLSGELERITGEKREEAIEARTAALAALGPQAAPLLVPGLEPARSGEAAPGAPTESAGGRGRSQRAAAFAEALRRVSTRAVTPELLALLDRGSEEAQRHSLRVLGASDDRARVGAELRTRFGQAQGRRRGELIAAIAELGTAEDLDFLGDVLGNPDPEVSGLALKALTGSRSTAAARQVLDLVRATEAAKPHVDAILAYYRACPEVVDEEHGEALVGLAAALSQDSRTAEQVLLVLADLEDALDSGVKKALKDLADSPSTRIREAAMVCLVRAGDRGMRRKLLEPYDERVDENAELASAWTNRADVKLRIADYKGAIKDYTEAMRRQAAFLRTEPEVFIGLARCHARLGKPKDAAEWIEKGGLSIVQLRQLARDPDFAEVVADEKLRKVFRLDDER